jgi:spore coat protein CotH
VKSKLTSKKLAVIVKNPWTGWILPLFFLVGLLGGCGGQDEPRLNGFGLAVVELEIEPGRIAELENSVVQQVEVPATVIYQGRRHAALVRYTGKASLFHRKRSFHVTLLQGSIKGRDQFRLSAQVADESALKQRLGFMLFKDAGLTPPETEPVTLYINQRLSGHYLWLDDINEQFYKWQGITLATAYKARYRRLGKATLAAATLPDLEIGFKVVKGDKTFTDLRALIEALHTTTDSSYARLATFIDLDNYLAYHATAVLLDHADGYANNYYIFRAEGETALRMTPWDCDQILDAEGKPAAAATADTVALWGENGFSAKLRDVGPLRARYLAVLTDLMQKFRARNLEEWIDAEALHIRQIYGADPLLRAQDQNREVTKLKENLRNRLDRIEKELTVPPLPEASATAVKRL